MEHVSEVVADAVFDVFGVTQRRMLECSGAQSPVDIVPSIVILRDALAEMPFETRPLVLIAENSGEMEVVVQDCG